MLRCVIRHQQWVTMEAYTRKWIVKSFHFLLLQPATKENFVHLVLVQSRELDIPKPNSKCHNRWFFVRCKQSDCGVRPQREIEQHTWTSLFDYTYQSKLQIHSCPRPFCSISFVTPPLHVNEVGFVCLPWFFFSSDAYFATSPIIVYWQQLTSSHMEVKPGVSSRRKKVNIEYSKEK